MPGGLAFMEALVKTRTRSIFVALALVVMSAAADPGQIPTETAARRVTDVLFIGNSYTYFNNLGDIVSAIADADPRGRGSCRGSVCWAVYAPVAHQVEARRRD